LTICIFINTPVSRTLLIFTFSFLFFLITLPPLSSTLFPYTTLFRSKLDLSYDSSVFTPHKEEENESKNGKQDTLQEADEIQRQRSEEHTSELQSRFDLVCRLLLEKKKKILLS